ncbi:MAG: DUF1800 domain-containing protein [Gemmatimonas sp.]
MRIASILALIAFAGVHVADLAAAQGTGGRPSQDVRSGKAPGALPLAAREQTVDQQVQHVLNRLAFGPRPGDAQAVRTMGVDRWIARQLDPERIPDGATNQFLVQFTTLGMTGGQLLEAYPPAGVLAAKSQREKGMIDSAKLRAQGRQSYAFLGEIATSRIARAVMSERQLDEVMVDFWENHFNVFAGKDRTRYFLAEYDANTIRPHVMGKFRDLLGAVAKSPAMLYYLDNWQSVADSGRPTLGNTGPLAQAMRRRAQQRVAQQRAVQQRAAQQGGQPGMTAPLQQLAARKRGLNENYARELMELHTLGVDGGYTQSDVIEVARALTGWTLDKGPNGGQFLFRAPAHDAGAKTILGKSFAAGRGVEEGEAVLDLLAAHPATAKFIATKLARRFVSDTPPPALVNRAAATFTRTGGDIRETVREIVTSPEFFATVAYRAKVKSPFELVASTLRAMNAAPDATPRTVGLVTRLGQPIFGHQAPNGYPETGDAWMNTGAILNRINFGLAVAADRIPGIRLDQGPATKELAALSRTQQVDGVIRELLGGAASNDTRQVLISGTNPFLEARGGASDSILVDTDNNAMTVNAMAGATTDPALNRRQERRQQQRQQAGATGPRQQAQAGKESVKPTAGASLTQTIGNLPPLAGFSQIVGLAIGAPEFQRR